MKTIGWEYAEKYGYIINSSSEDGCEATYIKSLPNNNYLHLQVFFNEDGEMVFRIASAYKDIVITTGDFTMPNNRFYELECNVIDCLQF